MGYNAPVYKIKIPYVVLLIYVSITDSDIRLSSAFHEIMYKNESRYKY